MSKDTSGTSSTEVATTEGAGLPAMYERNAVPAGSPDETTIPIVYLMADLSKPVKNGIAEPGDVIAAIDSNDTDPAFLIGGDADGTTFRAFILDLHRYVTRGGSGDDWERLPDDYVRGPDDNDVNVGFRYYVSVPGAEFPVFSLLLIKASGRPAYRKVNYEIDLAAKRESPDPVMIEFGTKETASKKGHMYHQWTAKGVEPTEDELAEVRPLVDQYRAQRARFRAQAAAEASETPAGAGF